MSDAHDQTPADPGWRIPFSEPINALLARVDWVSSVGARTTRALAVAAWIGAAGCWLTLFRAWGGAGWVLTVIALAPGVVLWSYARALDEAVDATRVEVALATAIDGAGSSLAGIGQAFGNGRFRLIRGGFRTLQAVRDIRTDVNNLGIDILNWAKIASPLFLVAAGLSVLAAAALVAIAVVAGLLRLVF